MRLKVREQWQGNVADIGTKVRIWIPAAYRDRTGVIVATEKASKRDVKVAPRNKFRVRPDGDGIVLVCSLEEMLPKRIRISQLAS
jgi:hypothetical protein